MLADSLTDLLPRLAEREARDPESYPAESVADLKACGFFGAPFSPALGGVGATLADCVLAIEQLATATPSLALMASMPLGLAGSFYGAGAGVAPAAHRASWAEQIDRAAAAYRAGDLFAACNSEKGAGGSLDATRTLAAKDGAGRWLITGEKILASSGKHADWFYSTAKVDPAELPGAGVVEFFLVSPRAPGVEILDDWDGFGMRSSESQTVRYTQAPAQELLGFPDFIATVQPLQYFFCLFAAIPLGCAHSILRALGTPAPSSPALRLRLSEAAMRYEAMRAYLLETAREWRPAAPPAYRAQVLRTKTYVTQEATKLSAELFALSGGRHYRRSGAVARALADSFAGTALRPPLPLGLDTLVDQFSLGEAE